MFILRAASLSLLLSLPAFADAGVSPSDAGAGAGSEPDLKAGEAVLSRFFAALQLPSEEEAAAAVVPHLHPSLLDETGKALSSDARRFSFKKAHARAKAYERPLSVARTRTVGKVGVGFRDTKESGVVVEFFVERKRGEKGLPAPVKVFFPEGGGSPSVLFMGSL